jgi:hypothetical protein
MAHLCGHTAVLCPFMRTNMCLLPFPAVCSPLSGTCPGKISAVYCKEDAKGGIRDIAYSNPQTGLQLVGCASGDWTAAASKSLELAGNENIIEVKTCRNNPRLVRNGGGARCRARKQPRGADCCCLDFGAARASNRKTALWHTAICDAFSKLGAKKQQAFGGEGHQRNTWQGAYICRTFYPRRTKLTVTFLTDYGRTMTCGNTDPNNKPYRGRASSASGLGGESDTDGAEVRTASARPGGRRLRNGRQLMQARGLGRNAK